MANAKRHGLEVRDDLELELRLRRIEGLLERKSLTGDFGSDDVQRSSAVPQVTNLRVAGRVPGAVTLAWDQVRISNLRRYELELAENLAFSANFQSFNIFDTLFSFNATFFPEAGRTVNVYARVRAVGPADTSGIYSTILNTTTGDTETPGAIPGTVDEAGFLAALAAADAAGGGIIYLQNGTYELEVQELTLPANTWIIGKGKESKLKFIGTGGTHLLEFDSLGGLEALTIEDTGTKGTGTRDVLRLGSINDTSDSTIRNVDILTPTGDHAILVNNTTATKGMLFDNVRIYRPAGHGIVVTDVNSVMKTNFMRSIVVESPGYGGTATAYGIKVAGPWEIMTPSIIDMDSAGVPIGLVLGERLAVDPNPQHAHDCTVTGLNITGTGADARGLEQNGSRCVVNGGVISLTGSSSEGVQLTGSSGQQTPEHNLLTGVCITAFIGYDQKAEANDNTIEACHFISCGDDVKMRGGNGRVANCVMMDATSGPSMLIASTATQTRICGNTIRDNASHGIRVRASSQDTTIDSNEISGCAVDGVGIVSGADQVIVSRNTFVDCGGDSVQADSGATNVQVHNNVSHGAGGVHYNIAGAGTELHALDNKPGAHAAVDHFSVPPSGLGLITEQADGTKDLISGLAVPDGDGGPDGNKRYLVHTTVPARIQHWTPSTSPGHGTGIINLYMGPNGDKDDELQTKYFSSHISDRPGASQVLAFMMISGTHVITPAAGDKIGLAISMEGESSSADIFIPATPSGLALNYNAEKAVLCIERLRE